MLDVKENREQEQEGRGRGGGIEWNIQKQAARDIL